MANGSEIRRKQRERLAAGVPNRSPDNGMRMNADRTYSPSSSPRQNKQRVQGGGGGGGNTAGAGATLGGSSVMDPTAGFKGGQVDPDAIVRATMNPTTPAKVPGQTQAPFGAMPSENDTLSVSSGALGGKSMVQRAQEFSEARRARSPLRRQTPASTPSPFQQRKQDKERQRFYDNILGNAGAGPNKDISLKNALGIIAEMEGTRIGAETNRRGQDIGAETSDLTLQTQQEVAANRDRVNMRLGEMDSQSDQAQLAQARELSEAKMTQQADQFDITQKFKGQELDQRKGIEAAKIAGGITEAGLGLDRERMKLLGQLGKTATGTDVLGEKQFKQETFDQLFQSIFNEDF